MNKITEQIKQIINTPESEIDVEKGALILLKINRNQILYKNIVRKNDVKRLLYNLNKAYELRVKPADKENVDQEIENDPVQNAEDNFERKADDENEKQGIILTENKGKRKDHDQLPEEIKAAFLENFNIYPQMRKLHEQLKLMNDKPEAERKEVMDELLKLDKIHRRNWEIYDGYQPRSEYSGQAVEADPKKISSARKYLSTNKSKVESLDGEEKAKLLAKMQERLDYLFEVEAGISDEQIVEYRKLGLYA